MANTDEYRRGADRLVDYLAGEFDVNGTCKSEPDNILFYYKMPAILSQAGRRKPAMRILAQIERRFLSGGQLKSNPFAEAWQAYIAGWAATGAGMLGRFDLAAAIMAAVSKLYYQTPGGYAFQSDETLIDIECSAAAAMGLVWSAQIERGLEVASFLRLALDVQPDADAFYARFELDGTAIANRDDQTWYYGLSDKYAVPAMFGTVISSLVWLWRITHKGWLIDLAESYLKLLMSHTGDTARLAVATKIGWSALLLNAHLGFESYDKFARANGDDLLERQLANGSIGFENVPESIKPVAKVWLMVWGCDCALTLLSLADEAA